MCKYLLSLEDFDPDKVLSNWRWRLPESVSLLAVSCFGDLFVRENAGSILWLDTLEAIVYQIAVSEEEWHRELAKTENIDRWFWPGFVDALESRGQLLSPGQCYAWRIHPVLGGALESANLMPMDVFAYHVVISQLHQLPEGFRPTGFYLERDIPK